MVNSCSSQPSLLIVALILLSQIAYSAADGSSCCDDNIIQVNGEGRVSVQPDVAIVSVGVTKTGDTSQQANRQVAQAISKITSILKKKNVYPEDIKTESISMYPQYEYPNGKVQLVGQTAQQFLSVTVRKIDQSGGNLGVIIDNLSEVDGVQLNGLRFDKADKTLALKEARRLAVVDARTKATDFSGFANRVVSKLLTIFDNTASYSSPIYRSADTMVKSAASEVPVGTQQISCSINARFALK